MLVTLTWTDYLPVITRFRLFQLLTGNNLKTGDDSYHPRGKNARRDDSHMMRQNNSNQMFLERAVDQWPALRTSCHLLYAAPWLWCSATRSTSDLTPDRQYHTIIKLQDTKLRTTWACVLQGDSQHIDGERIAWTDKHYIDRALSIQSIWWITKKKRSIVVEPWL